MDFKLCKYLGVGSGDTGSCVDASTGDTGLAGRIDDTVSAVTLTSCTGNANCGPTVVGDGYYVRVQNVQPVSTAGNRSFNFAIARQSKSNQGGGGVQTINYRMAQINSATRYGSEYIFAPSKADTIYPVAVDATAQNLFAWSSIAVVSPISARQAVCANSTGSFSTSPPCDNGAGNGHLACTLDVNNQTCPATTATLSLTAGQFYTVESPLMGTTGSVGGSFELSTADMVATPTPTATVTMTPTATVTPTPTKQPCNVSSDCYTPIGGGPTPHCIP
jgi:hypothetical protein